MEWGWKQEILSVPAGKYRRVLPQQNPQEQEFLQQNVLVFRWNAWQWAVPLPPSENAKEAWNCWEHYWKPEKDWWQISFVQGRWLRGQDHLLHAHSPLGCRLPTGLTPHHRHVHVRTRINPLQWPLQLIFWPRTDLLCRVTLASSTASDYLILLPLLQY